MNVRPLDPAFEMLCQVCGMDWQHLTENERGKVNAALKQIRALDPPEEHLPAMIEERAKAFHAVYAEIATTPQGIVNHWSSIIGKAKGLRSWITNAQRSRDCPTCAGDGWVPAGLDARGYDQSAPCPTCTVDRDQHRVDPGIPDSGVRNRDPAGVGALLVTCTLCGEEIYERERRTMCAQEITWQPATVHRAGGGIHDRGRAWKRTGALAHERCVTALAKGTLNQKGLFPLDQPKLL